MTLDISNDLLIDIQTQIDDSLSILQDILVWAEDARFVLSEVRKKVYRNSGHHVNILSLLKQEIVISDTESLAETIILDD